MSTVAKKIDYDLKSGALYVTTTDARKLVDELDASLIRIAALEAALTTASTMKMHWSSRKHQAEFKRLLGDKK